MVVIKLTAIAVFIAFALGHVQPANWTPFMPFGWEGVMGGAALIFFAYIGFVVYFGYSRRHSALAGAQV